MGAPAMNSVPQDDVAGGIMNKTKIVWICGVSLWTFYTALGAQ